MKLPLVTVIMPVYNVESYVAFAIESILTQSYEHLEVLIIDDGSTDSSSMICRSYEKKDPRVHVFVQENAGAAAARNRGLSQASGEFIMFMDSDDIIHPEAINILYEMMEQQNADMSIINFQETKELPDTWNSVGNIEPVFYSQHQLLRVLCGMDGDFNKRILMIVPWCKLYRKSMLNGLRFPEGIICEDEFMINQVLERCRNAVFTEQILYVHLRREESVMGYQYDRRKLVAMDAFEERVHLARKLGYHDCEAWMARTYIMDHIGNYCRASAQKCEDAEVYHWLKDNLRKKRKDYSHYLTWSDKIKCRVFLFSPSIYIKIKRRATGNEW